MAVTVKECLELQLLEVETLLTMFPKKGEINLDEDAVPSVQRYLRNADGALPPQLEFSMAVWCNKRKAEVKVELQVRLPHMYPHVAPQLYARSNALRRQQQLQLNTGLASHIGSLDSGEPCIYDAVQWVKDNSLPYLENSKISSESASKEVIVKEMLHRMWIYSHHIYRQELRKKIFDCAKKLNLTGFCLTGKPGVICVEGLQENCEEFWRIIRYPNWKHISCKHVENIETEGSVDNIRLFHAFEDLQFQAHGDYGLRNDYHMDLGQFLDFLKQHRSEHIFQILFGVKGKLSDK
ncbi:PREDICTED: RWD domain-containing protein 2A isoform X1 [Buceros rhinoceros silvestris]|uniref:RWD domain-containing protein 2A isoform X1 n=1 Tax=Buceros rhinoceros silvestris TaxID=175836 RepID=UPI000528C43C|nr:PREDICTED: RWD domain-containing protein 2A isoform X1 [Buceros rhinoceros silvestris]